jgi:hypothetical protein
MTEEDSHKPQYSIVVCTVGLLGLLGVEGGEAGLRTKLKMAKPTPPRSKSITRNMPKILGKGDAEGVEGGVEERLGFS